MRQYELALVFNSSLSADERKKLLETIKGWLKDVTITKENEMGQKAMAYAIKRERIGFYYIMNFEGELVPTDFEKRLFNNEQVLRHLLVRTK